MVGSAGWVLTNNGCLGSLACDRSPHDSLIEEISFYFRA